ncbi:MAG: hypothetical protein LBR80_09205, partial [Deltaproteobacteria bacterium]|nr:hypothetical protein [Deltaproteobacteria bacterium]
MESYFGSAMYDATVISRRGIHDEEPDGAAAVQSARLGSHASMPGTFCLPFNFPEVNDQWPMPASG